MKLWTTIVALAAAGCTSTATREDMDKTRSDLEKVRIDMVNKNEMQSHLYDQLVNANKALQERLVKLEMLANALRSDVERHEDKLKNPHSAPSAPAALSDTTPAAPAVPARKVEDILLETEAALSNMRASRIKPEDVAVQLKPWAKDAAPYILDELRKSITRIDYTIQLEFVLSRLPPADLRVPLQKAFMEPGVRVSAARIVGAAGDKELSRLMEPLASGGDEDFRLVVGDSLVRCRNAAGITPLIACLKSDQRDTRTIAISSLRPLNRGQDFGYRAGRGAEENAAAVKSWEEWGEKFGKTLFD